jgi:RNA polymerase sigma factor (sigma-70 family)
VSGDPNRSERHARQADLRDVRERHLEARGRPPGYHVVARLCREEEVWMVAMTRRVGRRLGVDPDDLYQELLEELLHGDDLELDRHGWRSWVTQRAIWRAKAMARRDRRLPVPSEPTEEPAVTVSEPLDVDGDIRRLRAMKLNPDEARILLYLRWGFGDSPAEFAELAGLSQEKVRQDKRRAIKKILGRSSLTPAELQAISAGLRERTIAGAAARLEVSEKVFTGLLREAAQKIGRAYDEAGEDVHDV